jgi:hypothetical protein
VFLFLSKKSGGKKSFLAEQSFALGFYPSFSRNYYSATCQRFCSVVSWRGSPTGGFTFSDKLIVFLVFFAL